MAVVELPAARRKPGHVTVQTRFFALRFNARVLLMTLLATLLLAVLSTWAMTLGSFSIPFVDVARAVVGDASADQEFVVRTLRLPRVISAVLIGAALAMAGAIFQGLVRNALVAPDIIGIDEGASLFAVFWIVTGQTSWLLPVAAFAGALLTAGIIYLLTWKGGISANRLILVGIGVGATIGAGTTYLTLRYPIEIVRPAIVWTIGSLYASTWQDVRVLLVFLAILTPASLALMWRMRTLQLGDDVTRVLGLPLERTRAQLIVVGCGLAAVAVAIAGPIGFVALMVPHIARMLAGPMSGSTLLLTAVLGALYLLAADVIGQHFLPVALPVGVVTAAVGAPYFLFLLYRSSVRV